jgi:hypothetical protein
MRLLLVAAALGIAGCAYHPPDSLEYDSDTLHTEDMEAAIKAAKPGEPRCDAACRRASESARPG